MTDTLTPFNDVLDLRAIPPHQRHPLIFRHFDALATGQSLQLVNDHDPQPLRRQFEDRADGTFEWTVVDAGPAVWRIRVTRIAGSAGPSAGAKGDACCSGGACCG